MKKNKKTKTVNQIVNIEKNSFSHNGKGLVKFSNGLTITDKSEQHNGTRYDIKSMNIGDYDGTLTANHSGKIEDVIGDVPKVRKVANNRVVVDSIQFAVNENALARYAHDMILSRFIKSVSIETTGPWPDEDGVYKDSNLVGLSVVTVGNNKSAKFNKLALNSIKESKKLGLDTSVVEKKVLCDNKVNNKILEEDMKFFTITNSRQFDVGVSYTNAAGDKKEATLSPGESVDVAENQKESVEKQIKEAVQPKQENGVSKEQMADMLKDAVQPIANQVKELEQKVFDNGAKAPEFKESKGKKVNVNGDKVGSMSTDERAVNQIESARVWLTKGSPEAQQMLNSINEHNLEKLKEAGKVNNVITISDMGNFVISPELLTEIEGFRSDYKPLLDILDWKETLSQQMSWLNRSGDIDMEEVEFCDDGADGNLKPISEYTAAATTKDLKELAAVTPICDAATRFLAVDLLSDAAEGYRNDYDRKRAQIAIARMQQAVDSSGLTKVYTTTSDVNALKSLVNVWSELTEEVPNGTFVFSYKTYGEIFRRFIGSNLSGDTLGLFTTGNQPLLVGRPYVVVPNDLMPELNTASTLSFTVDGATVTINKGVFYFDPSTFVGRVSGGLKFDLSAEAAYEVDGSVKSAFQRNEVVMRGSFFRNAGIKDENKVSALQTAGVS